MHWEFKCPERNDLCKPSECNSGLSILPFFTRITPLASAEINYTNSQKITPITCNSQRLKLFWYCISSPCILSLESVFLSRCQTSQKMKDHSALVYYRGGGLSRGSGIAMPSTDPLSKFVHRSDFTNIHLFNHFISHFPAKPLFLFLLQPSLSAKQHQVALLQFSQALIARS